MGEVTFKFELNEWEKWLASVTNNLKKKLPILKEIARTIGFQDIIQHFSDEQGPEGKWTPRSSLTQLAYERLGKRNARYKTSNKILQLTGKLRQSLLLKTGKVSVRGSDSILLFTNVVYAGSHNYGDPKKNTPQREFMYLGDKGHEEMANAFLKAVSE